MRLSVTPVAIADYFEVQIRQARIARGNARLRRELSRLPRYVADDIGVSAHHDQFVNFVDD